MKRSIFMSVSATWTTRWEIVNKESVSKQHNTIRFTCFSQRGASAASCKIKSVVKWKNKNKKSVFNLENIRINKTKKKKGSTLVSGK